MKTHFSRLVLFICLQCIVWSTHAQTPPSLGTASAYGLLASDSIVVTDTIKVKGNAGAAAYVHPKVVATNIYTSVATAQADLATAKSFLSGQSGTSIPGTLNGQNLSAGVYTISGNARLTDTLILTGDSSSVFIFNVSGGFDVGAAGVLFMGTSYGIRPENIYWNIGGKVTINGGNAFGGIILAAGDIVLNNAFNGNASFLSQQTIKLNGVQQVNYAGMGTGYTLYSPAELITTKSLTCTWPLTLTCSEFLKNGNFEYLDPAAVYPCPLDVTDEYEIGVCPWDVTPMAGFVNSTPDVFNTCSNTASGSTGHVNVPLNGFGTQAPYNGNGYVGVYSGDTGPNRREGLLQDFLPSGSALQAGRQYYFEMRASLAEVSGLATTLGFRLTNGLSSMSTISYYHPTAITDKTNWTKIATCFTAVGTERCIWIDNFMGLSGPVAAATPASGYAFSGIHPFNFAYYYIDNVSLRPMADAGPDKTVCSSTSVGTCNPIDGATYSWSGTGPGTINFSSTSVINPTVTFGGPGVYTLTVSVTYGGCTATDQVVITSNAVTSATAVASPYTISLGASTTLNATAVSVGGPITYSWSPATGLSATTGASVTATPTTTTTYTVTATNSFGCTKTDTVKVNVVIPGCTLSTIHYTVPAGGATSSAIFGAAPVISNSNIQVNGDLTINVDITFVNCNFVMASNTKILVPSRTLSLTQYTHLYSCGNMWDGIHVSAGATVNVNTNAFIEDAKNAIVSINGGRYTLNTAIFNRNFTAVDVQAFAGTHTGTVRNTIFTSRYIPSYANTASNYSVASLSPLLNGLIKANMRGPYNLEASVYGMKATSVTTLQVGHNTAGVRNTFDIVQTGIYANMTNVTVHNNLFKNILTPALCLSCYGSNGYGIDAVGDPSGNGTHTINVGGVVSLQANTFQDINAAVRINNYKTVYVADNTIDNAVTGAVPTAAYGTMGISVKPSNANSVRVINNDINNCKTGILINRNGTTAINANQLQVTANTISANTNGFCVRGINVTDLVAGTSVVPTTSEIRLNHMTRTRTGIDISNAKKPINVSNNTIVTEYMASGNINGMKFTACQNLVVKENEMTYNVNTASLSGGNMQAYGIYLSGSSNMILGCNETEYAARGMVFQGACSSPTSGGFGFRQNVMRRAQDGWVLLNSGVIGTQGGVSNANDNIWDMTTTPNFTRAQTYVENTTNANTASILYVTNSTTGLARRPTNNQGTSSQQYVTGTGIVTTGVTGPLDCYISNDPEGLSLAPGVRNAAAAESEMLEVIGSTPVTEFDKAVNWELKRNIYRELYTGNAVVSDEKLQAFFDGQSNTAIGLFARIEEKFENGDYTGAVALNNSVQAENVPEQNQQVMNEMILSQLVNNGYVYTQNDMARIREIAYQCPVSGGNAVYQARNLYRTILDQVLDFDDNCSPQSESVATSAVETETGSSMFNLYPNPNNGNMTLTHTLSGTQTAVFTIYDNAGKMVQVFNLHSNASQLNITGLANGSYTYRVMVDNQAVKSGKIVVVK